MVRCCWFALVVGLWSIAACEGASDDVNDPAEGEGEGEDEGDFVDIALSSAITRVQPMTGIVLWDGDHDDDSVKQNGTIALEYAYFGYAQIVSEPLASTWNWEPFEALLDRVAARGHQTVVRFYETYPGEETMVPEYIKSRTDYLETHAISEGARTGFPDWENAEWMRFHQEFFAELAARYDDDPRLAFLQVGFGLWGEYHIYDAPHVLGRQFPTKAYQILFLRHMDEQFSTLKWSISIDAAADEYSPFATDSSLLALGFGNFDDSFMQAEHSGYNEKSWDFFQHTTRSATAPGGGELSYYTDEDQQHSLDVAGLHGRTFEQLSARFEISYMIGNDQPAYQTDARIKAAGMATGYAFAVTAFSASPTSSRVTVQNVGIAPIYYDAFVAIDGVRSATSLKGLLPGDSRDLRVARGGSAPVLTIVADRLVPGQTIQFRADLSL